MPGRKKSSFYRKAGRVANVAQKALKVALMTKSLLNVEYKHVDVAPNTITPSSSGTLLAMNAIAQGDTSSTRDGLSVLNKSVYVRLKAIENASATTTHLRVLLFRDTQPRGGGSPAVTDVLESANSLALMNNVNTARYKIYFNKNFVFSSSGTQTEIYEFYKKLNLHTRYNSSAGAVTDIETNGFFLLFISDQATNTPSITYTTRMRYLDN